MSPRPGLGDSLCPRSHGWRRGLTYVAATAASNIAIRELAQLQNLRFDLSDTPYADLLGPVCSLGEQGTERTTGTKGPDALAGEISGIIPRLPGR